MQTGKTLSDPNRFKFDGDGYYLKSAAEMREIWDAEIPGACDSTLLIADRVQSYADVWELRDRMPISPEAAVAAAAHDVLVALFPELPSELGLTPAAAVDLVEAAYVAALAAIPDGQPRPRASSSARRQPQPSSICETRMGRTCPVP